MEFIQQHLQQIVVVSLVVGFFGYRFIKFARLKAQLPALLKGGAALVDVRSPSEFAAGHNPKAKNIPLQELPTRLKSLDKGKPVIVCCASGTRSGMALGILKGAGFSNVLNAGPWQNTLV